MLLQLPLLVLVLPVLLLMQPVLLLLRLPRELALLFLVLLLPQPLLKVQLVRVTLLYRRCHHGN